MSNDDRYKSHRRDEKFANKIATRIWSEIPSQENPYIAENCRCHGYDVNELIRYCSFSDVLYLLLRGELPSAEQRKLFNSALVALINPGPRHPATRAAMNAGVGKTDTAHILPISLSILGGSHLGGVEVEASMRFIKKHSRKDPEETANELFTTANRPDEGDWHIAPGFGTRFGGVDIVQERQAHALLEMSGSSECLRWGNAFAETIKSYNMGWLSTGVAAAVFTDLGFLPRAGAGLFQIASAPGLLAHGLEFANKPYTAMPFVDDASYIIDTNKEDD
jgi:citrate synthase